MKLSQLLKLRQDLLSMDVTDMEESAGQFMLNEKTIDYLEYDDAPVKESIEVFAKQLATVRKNISKIVEDIQEDIDRLDKQYKKLCKEEEQFHLRASIQDNRELRRYIMHADVKKTVIGRLGHYINWKYPGLEIGPGDGEWTGHLVGMDPLYLVDIYDEFLNGTKAKFHPDYQNRLRTYKINHGDLSQLPKEQFGFVFSWNVFNYFSLDTIELYLAQIKPLLKPGGVVMFSYNNCENYKSVEMFENHFMTYVPNKELVGIVKKLGYKIVSARDEPTMTSWMEIKAPGELTSIRAGQTLGKINRVEP
jgi:SAM-dependent methyltransferase